MFFCESHTERGVERHKGDFKMVTNLLNDLEVGQPDKTGDFKMHSNKINVPVIAGWQGLFSKEDGTLLNTLMVM